MTEAAIAAAIASAYARGHRAGELRERERIAEGHAELDAVEVRAGVSLYRDRVGERIALMERLAARNRCSVWRGSYPGGPVDFESGRLVSLVPGAMS